MFVPLLGHEAFHQGTPNDDEDDGDSRQKRQHRIDANHADDDDHGQEESVDQHDGAPAKIFADGIDVAGEPIHDGSDFVLAVIGNREFLGFKEHVLTEPRFDSPSRVEDG